MEDLTFKAENTMKKILVIITTGFVSWGGLTTSMMNYYRAMNKEGLRFDFISCNTPDKELLEQIHTDGNKYERLPDRKKKTVSYMIALYRLVKRNSYDIVHIHGNSATMAIDLFPCRFAGVGRRIIHVHTTNTQHPFLHKILLSLMNRLATDRVAVSQDAGRYLYGANPFYVLNNAIDSENYRYSEKSRRSFRMKFDIEAEAFVIGSVGKLTETKNHIYLVEVFAEIFKTRPDSVLLIVGEGPERDRIEKRIRELGLAPRCRLVGKQTDIPGCLSAMDFFVFPSLYEGFGLALLEAEASGLPCICSENIPSQVMVVSNCKAIPLKDQSRWAAELAEDSFVDREKASRDAICSIVSNQLDVGAQADELRKYYLK